jgi:AcrR family transcriptional regulator
MVNVFKSYQKSQAALRRLDWVNAARFELLERGIQSVKVRKISNKLGVTTGAFYHVYKNLEELHNDLVTDWKTRNTDPLIKAILEAAPDGRKQLVAWDSVIQFEQDYNPIYDNVIRDWARISSHVKNAVNQIDAKRINVLQDIYVNLGYDKKTAEFRAKIMYYHQIGYQTLEVEESLDQRLMNAAYYAEIISENPQKYPYNNPDGVLSIMKSNLGKNK